MEYKYRKGQIFGKRLKVPRSILNKVYNSSLTLEEYYKYHLDDKIPTSCISSEDRKIIQKFGVDKCRKLDWEILNWHFFHSSINMREILMSIDSDTKDLNLTFYELIKDKIRPSEYLTKMKEIYSDRFIDFSQYDDSNIPYQLYDFNEGIMSLKDIINNWSLLKEKDLSLCLLNDDKVDITDSEIKSIMDNYKELTFLISRYGDIYSFVNGISKIETEEEKRLFIKGYTDEILEKSRKKTNYYDLPIILGTEEYKEIFKYSSLEDCLKSIDDYRAGPILEELKTLPDGYIFEMSIPFEVLLDRDVLSFVGTYGLKNVVDFDNECGHFFSKNNCEMLKLMYDMYLHYANNEHDPKKSIFTINHYDENGNYVERAYTKDEFYEAMRRMIIYGPSDWDYIDKAPDYRDMTGEFRVRNSELFISEDAPEELQQLFYTKSITPKLLIDHPEYIEYLRDKDLESCFKDVSIKVDGSDSLYGYENLYAFLNKRFGFDKTMDFVTSYNDIFDVFFDRNSLGEDYFYYSLNLSIEDSLEDVQTKSNRLFRRLVIEKGIPYTISIPNSFVEQYPNMFISDDAPDELQDALYNRKISAEFIKNNPSYMEYLKDVDLELLFKYISVRIYSSKNLVGSSSFDDYEFSNLIKYIEESFGRDEAFEIMMSYSKYLDYMYDIKELSDLHIFKNISKDELIDEFDNAILKSIVSGKIKYDEDLPDSFKKKNPTLFLDSTVSVDIKRKFYNREFTLKDFRDNPELLDIFNQTNVVCGLSEDLSWIIPLFDKEDDKKISNENRLKVVEAYEKIQNKKLRDSFVKYVLKYGENINLDRIDYISEVFSRLEYSNSIELSSFSEQLAVQLLDSEDPLGKLKKIEKVFLENNSPLCGKMFLCFQILYPSMSKYPKFNFNSDSRVAPSLKDESLPNVGFHASNDEKRLMVIFNDLLRVAYRSNERSFTDYLANLEEGNEIYYYLQNNGFDLGSLSEKEKETLLTFVNHLEVLYNNTKNGSNQQIDLSELSLIEKLKILGESFHESSRYELKDRIVRSFCYTAGIKSFAELKQLSIDSKREQRERIDRNLREIEENGGVFRIQEGDFVRGIGYYDTLGSSLNAGNYCKEQLGSFNGTSGSDTTPLDVDLTLITRTDSLYQAISDTPTGFGFGNVYVIFRKDNPNINISRDKEGNLTENPYDPRKVEFFGTHVDGTGGYETHWGARTGFSFADVDYILYKEKRTIDSKKPYDENGNVNYVEKKKSDDYDDLQAIKFEIAKNGYYIPVIDFSGRLIFTKEEFKEIRDKMDGLSYFGEDSFTLSEYLVTPEVEEIARELTQEAEDDTKKKREIVNGIIKEVLDEMGIDIKYKSDGDLSSNSAEFIDTGSTGRGTNVPYDGDFDFFMRLDADIMKEPEKLREFKNKIIDKLKEHNPESYVETGNGDIRFKKVSIDESEEVDIDISFGVKTNKVQYSSDECLRDRLNTIKRLYPDQYKNVVANIILAKKVLKDPEVNAYKPRRSDPEQGGMGGIGIENWILQNGGSFVQACQSFLAAATDENGNMVPFDQFKNNYQLWDFGENHFSARKGNYLHDNFIECNMNQGGYEKMVHALQTYQKTIDRDFVSAKTDDIGHNK